jgi:hypothetical protein
MIQSYSLILWAKAKQEDFKVSVDKAYQLLMTLKEFGPETSPNYLPAYRKKDVKRFELNYENLEALMEKKKKKQIFPDLGYTIQLFSSLTDDNSAGIMMSIGISYPKLVNSLVVDLPYSLDVFNDNISRRLIILFSKCTILFDPYYGCIANSSNTKKFDGLWKNDMPTSVHWINFWGNDIVNRVSENMINNIQWDSSKKVDDKGYILILQKKPIDNNLEEDIRLQSNINKRLGLGEQTLF